MSSAGQYSSQGKRESRASDEASGRKIPATKGKRAASHREAMVKEAVRKACHSVLVLAQEE
jgi:hypothetical protein